MPAWPNEDWWIAAGTIVLAIATIALFVATYLLYRTTRAAILDQREHSEELFSAERRAWVKIDLMSADPPAFEEQRGEKRASVRVSFRRENVGLSPAYNVWTHLARTKLTFENAWFAEFKAEVLSVADSDSHLSGGSNLFPGQHDLMDGTVVFQDVPEDGLTDAYVYGYVSYRDPISKKAHCTPFIRHFWVVREEGGGCRWGMSDMPSNLPPT